MPNASMPDARLMGLLDPRLTAQQGLIGSAGRSKIDAIMAHPLVNLGLGMIANSYNRGGQFGPALAGGLKQMQANQESQQQRLLDTMLVEKYRTKQAAEAYKEQALQSIPQEYRQLMQASPKLGEQALSRYYGLDVQSPEAEAQAIRKAQAGRAMPSQITVSPTIGLGKEGEKLGGKVAETIVDDFKDTRKRMDAALSSWESLDRIDKSIAKGAFVGPAASNVALTGLQVADFFGVAGDTVSERLANTRNIMQDLAKIQVSARSQMLKQGDITEHEQVLLAMAESGDLSKFTARSLQEYVDLNKRINRRLIELGNDRIRKFAGRAPEYGELADLFTVEVPNYMYPTPTAKEVAALKANAGDAEFERSFDEVFGTGTAKRLLGK